MKEKIMTYTLENLPEGKTDWEKVRKMTDRQINKAAREDPDAQPLTKKELKKFKRVHPLGATDIATIRNQLKVTQEVFAAYFGISVRTLQEWEQGRRQPTGPALTLLNVIRHNPESVQKSLNR